MAALGWDDALAASAQAWAGTCSMASSWAPGVGENLAYGYGSWVEAVDAWYRQVDAYNYSAPGFQQNSDSFTQVGWPW